MVDVPHLLIPTMAVFRALASERRAAIRDKRTPMLFCYLTAEDFRPVWMPAEAVGGRAAMQTEIEDISAAGPSSQLSAILSTAMKQVGTGSRFFRTIAQWDLLPAVRHRRDRDQTQHLRTGLGTSCCCVALRRVGVDTYLWGLPRDLVG